MVRDLLLLKHSLTSALQQKAVCLLPKQGVLSSCLLCVLLFWSFNHSPAMVQGAGYPCLSHFILLIQLHKGPAVPLLLVLKGSLGTSVISREEVWLLLLFSIPRLLEAFFGIAVGKGAWKSPKVPRPAHARGGIWQSLCVYSLRESKKPLGVGNG